MFISEITFIQSSQENVQAFIKKISFKRQTMSSYLNPQQFASKNVAVGLKNRHPKTKLNPLNIASLMIPQQLLTKKQFSNTKHYTHIFTPLTYDFTAYPKIIKQIIKPNPKSAQCGKINAQITYVIYQKILILWKPPINSEKQEDIIKIHKFQENINIVQGGQIRNFNLFKKQSVVIMAISFMNRMTLYKVDEKQLKIEDLMLKYKMKSCRRIQKIKFTKHNEVLFSGDSGQLSIVSFNSQSKQTLLTLSPPILKKYLSSQAFDYSTRNIIKQISLTSPSQTFIYVLFDRIKKSSYLMYCIRKTMNQIIKLKQEPKYIQQETFLDIYKLEKGDHGMERNKLKYIDRIKEKDVQKRAMESYGNLWGEGVKDGFKIMGINSEDSKQGGSYLEQGIQLVTEVIQKTTQPYHNEIQPQINRFKYSPTLHLTTKCGYIINLIHRTLPLPLQSTKQPLCSTQAFLFLSQPLKLPSTIHGQSSFLQSKSLPIISQFQKQPRKNHVVKSLGLNNLTLMNNMLMFYSKQKTAMVKFEDMKKVVYEVEKKENEVYYVDMEEYQRVYEVNSRRERKGQNNGRRREVAFETLGSTKNGKVNNDKMQYVKMYNVQRKWSVFDNEGQGSIYLLELRHIITTYLYYKLQFSNQQLFTSNGSSSPSQSFLNADLKFQSIIQKIIRIYGYTQFLLALVQILLMNTPTQHEYFYLQKELFLQIVKRQFDYELPLRFDQWFYRFYNNRGMKVVVTENMLQYVWLLLFEYQHKNVLASEKVEAENLRAGYFQVAKEYEEVYKKAQYSAYGHALQTVFFKFIEPVMYLRAKQFKQNQKLLIKFQENLQSLITFLQSKKFKQHSPQYRSYLTAKISNISKSQHPKPYESPYHSTKPSFFNTTFSTSLNNTTTSDSHIHSDLQQIQQPFFTPTNQKYQKYSILQSKQILEKTIIFSIKKIITLINMLGVLAQKDQRQGLPNVVEILTDVRQQVKVGEYFFKEELYLGGKEQDAVDFVHPELVREVEVQLPQLRIKEKIEFLKFKISRGLIRLDNGMTVNDLKSLNLKRLSNIGSSPDISQLRSIFLGPTQQLDQKKYFFYCQFISMCMLKHLRSIAQLSSYKDQNFSALSSESSSWSKKPFARKFPNPSLLSSKFLSFEHFITSQQHLEYEQEQLHLFYKQLQFLFTNYLNQLKILAGNHYHKGEKYLDYLIEMLVQNFGTETVLVQFVEVALKENNFVEKVHFMKKLLPEKKIIKEEKEKPIFIAPKQQVLIINQNSSYNYLAENQYKKSDIHQDTTMDTWRNNSWRQ